jgi:hypothetical protein
MQSTVVVDTQVLLPLSECTSSECDTERESVCVCTNLIVVLRCSGDDCFRCSSRYACLLQLLFQRLFGVASEWTSMRLVGDSVGMDDLDTRIRSVHDLTTLFAIVVSDVVRILLVKLVAADTLDQLRPPVGQRFFERDSQALEEQTVLQACSVA